MQTLLVMFGGNRPTATGAVHQLHKIPCYSKAQAGPAFAVCKPWLGLAKGLKYCLLVLGWYAGPGIDHGEAKSYDGGSGWLKIGLFTDTERDTANLGEFQGIAQKVNEYLPQFAFVGLHLKWAHRGHQARA